MVRHSIISDKFPKKVINTNNANANPKTANTNNANVNNANTNNANNANVDNANANDANANNANEASAPGTHGYLVKLSKLQRAVSVDGRPDVLAVVAVLHQLQLPDTAHVGQPRLDLSHVQHLQVLGESTLCITIAMTKMMVKYALIHTTAKYVLIERSLHTRPIFQIAVVLVTELIVIGLCR